MSKPDISVIIPVYNVAPYLRRCTDSVLSQKGPSLEVLLIDDGSTDGSGALCDAIAAEDARVQVVHKPNGGLSSARNAGLDLAQGHYVSFVDSDDYLEEDAYRDLVHLAQKFQVPLVCGAGLTWTEKPAPKSWGCARKRKGCSREKTWYAGSSPGTAWIPPPVTSFLSVPFLRASASPWE